MLLIQRLGQTTPQVPGTSIPKSKFCAIAKNLIASVKRGEIQLDAPQPGYNPVTHRDIIRDLSGLIVILRFEMLGDVLYDLFDLGYTKEETDDMQIAKLRTDMYPGKFLQFLHNALNQRFIPLWSSNAIRDLVLNVNAEYARDGIRTASQRLTKLKNILRSKTFATGVAVPTLTTVLAVLTLFGVTDGTVHEPMHTWIIVIIMAGFILSMVLTLLLVDKMLT